MTFGGLRKFFLSDSNDLNFIAEAASLSIGDDVNDITGDVLGLNLHVDGDIFISNGSLQLIGSSSLIAENLSIGEMGFGFFVVGDESSFEVQQVAITGSSSTPLEGNLRISQDMDSTRGLTVTDGISVVDGGPITVDFDSSTNGDSFDWALRVAGDETASLKALIDDGLLSYSGNSAPVNLVFDDSNPLLGDFTYLAVGSVAVPEPSSFLLSGLAATLILSRRRRS